jgi:predicted DNA-binding transcriptional regulator AlpA
MHTPQIPDDLAGARVLTERDAAAFTSLSLPYFRRLRREGHGPRFLRLGERRLGYRVSDLKAWLETRAEPMP